MNRMIQSWTNPTEHANNFLIGSLVSRILHSFYLNKNEEKPENEFNEFWRMTLK